MFKKLRIAVLLFILATVAVNAWRAKAKVTEWKSTLHVAMFPINADGSDASQRYIQDLQKDDFEPIEHFIASQAQRYDVNVIRPVSVELGAAMNTLPPALTPHPNMLDAISWSLRMRWWAWRNTPEVSVRPDVRMYLLYHDPATTNYLPHSIGLAKGQIGMAHIFASRNANGSNAVVITHEMLHTFGATDRYAADSNMPRFPDGFANPGQTPRYPQTAAEIMAGRIPISETEARIPDGLFEAMIGPETAAEIGWRAEKQE
ncbi:MAG TPA: hypothetical protein VFW00_12485 [Rhodocyclaceae bacterium]|nr:hypothetical protein [Rhodocyclaceae bacterium]